MLMVFVFSVTILVYTHLFKVYCEASYPNFQHSRPHIPDGFHLIFERGLREEISQTYAYMLSAKH